MTFPEINIPRQTRKTRVTLDRNWIWDLCLIAILLIGAYFRFVGIRWDDTFHLHPDERFLTMVETAITPVRETG